MTDLDIAKLAEDLEITDMPGDLRVILEKYVALHTLASNCLSKDVTSGMGLNKEVFGWLERDWEGGDEEYDPICENCYRDVTGDEDE
uniref:Uncharacterized protein n=1 Tax=viral metagenome TaxID=1070528 RepID=A0A6M3M592_9ZZZZ